MPSKKKIAVLISGNGSNLQSIIDACKNNSICASICVVISNVSDAYGLDRAKKENIPNIIIDNKKYESREEFDTKVLNTLNEFKPDLVVLAGFMRILSDFFVKNLQGKLMNIHPSLLPKYKGLDTHERAIKNGDKDAGLTIHFVTEELDGGPILYQKNVLIEKKDTPFSLSKKVMIEEHKAYPKVIGLFIHGRLKLHDGKIYLDDKILPNNGINF